MKSSYSSPRKAAFIPASSASVKPPIGERMTETSGISCLVLSIARSRFMKICTSIASK